MTDDQTANPGVEGSAEAEMAAVGEALDRLDRYLTFVTAVEGGFAQPGITRADTAEPSTEQLRLIWQHLARIDYLRPHPLGVPLMAVRLVEWQEAEERLSDLIEATTWQAHAKHALRWALSMRMHGEGAPGAGVTWREWEEAVEKFLRGTDQESSGKGEVP